MRTPDKAASLVGRGVGVREGDYSRPDTLPSALEGVQRLLLVSGSEVGHRVRQHAAVIDAAKAAGVERVVYTSILRAHTTRNPLAPEHKETEAHLRRSGLRYTVLRNGWYSENYTGQLDRYLERGVIVGATGAGRVSAATRLDYAAAAAEVLFRDEPVSQCYELGGSSFDFEELAATLSRISGSEILYRSVTTGELVNHLRAEGMDASTARFVAGLDESIARGELETASQDLARLVGRPLTSLGEAMLTALKTR